MKSLVNIRVRVWSVLLMLIVMPPGMAAGEPAAIDNIAMRKGFSTLDSMCFSCHSPDASLDSPIAPPIAAIKNYYVAAGTGFDAFQESLVRFINNPMAENARIPGAVSRFGVMPKMSFDDAVIADVAYYLYHTALESADWYTDNYAVDKARYASAGPPAPTTLEDYRRQGQQIAMQTKTELGSNLKRAIQAGGPESAVEFCKTRANPIAVEMSAKLGADIKRVSDRPRNPENSANAQELDVIEAFKDALAEGAKPAPVVREHSGQVIAYFPIVTNAMCLQCHGAIGTDISPATRIVIQDEYPGDQAVGYGENELRGLFVVGMDKRVAGNQ